MELPITPQKEVKVSFFVCEDSSEDSALNFIILWWLSLFYFDLSPLIKLLSRFQREAPLLKVPPCPFAVFQYHKHKEDPNTLITLNTYASAPCYIFVFLNSWTSVPRTKGETWQIRVFSVNIVIHVQYLKRLLRQVADV